MSFLVINLRDLVAKSVIPGTQKATTGLFTFTASLDYGVNSRLFGAIVSKKEIKYVMCISQGSLESQNLWVVSI